MSFTQEVYDHPLTDGYAYILEPNKPLDPIDTKSAQIEDSGSDIILRVPLVRNNVVLRVQFTDEDAVQIALSLLSTQLEGREFYISEAGRKDSMLRQRMTAIATALLADLSAVELAEVLSNLSQ